MGLAVRDSVRIDPDARAKAHRAAWNHLEHLGIEARSSFTTETYLSLTHLPAYDASLDMLAVTPMGELVGNCIAWADDASGVAVFEPVGVAPAWRGRRVASSMMGEALRRLKARGFAEARASTASFNHAAVAAYLACGFKRADECWWWEKTIDQAPNGQQSKTSGPRGQRKIAVKPHPGGWESAWNREEP